MTTNLNAVNSINKIPQSVNVVVSQEAASVFYNKSVYVDLDMNYQNEKFSSLRNRTMLLRRIFRNLNISVLVFCLMKVLYCNFVRRENPNEEFEKCNSWWISLGNTPIWFDF